MANGATATAPAPMPLPALLAQLRNQHRLLGPKLTLAAIALAGVGSVLSTGVYQYLNPGTLAGLTGLPSAWIIPLGIAAVWLLVIAAGVGLFYAALLGPVRQVEAVVPQQAWEPLPAGTLGEISTLKNTLKKQADVLAAMQSNKQTLTDEVGRLLATEKSALATLTAAVALTHDRLILTDRIGNIRDVSPAALELLDAHRADLLGRQFHEAVQLYERHWDKPEEHPLGNLIGRVIESRSSIPRLEDVLLINRAGRHVRAFVAAAAILEKGSAAAGALVRLEPLSEKGGTAEPLPPQIREAEEREAGPAATATDAFERRLTELIEIAHNQQALHALLFLSPDGLDTINDTYGHWAGEELLWQIGQLLRTESPNNADCFRVGGTHLAVLMPFIKPDEAHKIAEGVRVAVDGREFKWQELRYEATISVGMVPITPDAEGYKVLMGLASNALIAAKAKGGNQVVAHMPDAKLTARRRQDQEWITWTSRRLKEGHGHMISQTIEPALPDSKLPPMMEVLLRIEDDDGAWVQPTAFLPSIVRHNLTAQIDLWLLKRVLQGLKENNALLTRYSTVTINLARSSLTEASFAERVNEALAESRVPPSHICFEIDALTSINHASDVHRFVKLVQPTGARFALDRCKAALGLNALSTLPIEFVKIHESLVRRSVNNAVDRGYVAWINQVVHQLGRKTIATGIEDAPTLDAMRQLRVDYVQGMRINKLGPLVL